MLDNELKVTVKQDALEGFRAFKKFRNMMFILLLLSLLIQQSAFWLVHTGKISLKNEQKVTTNEEKVPKGPLEESVATTDEVDKSPESTKITAEQVTRIALHYSQIVAMYTAILYCLALIMGLKILLAGQLPGVRGTSKAFFLSLILIVVVIPWQSLVLPPLQTALFSYDELIQRHSEFLPELSLTEKVCYFGRFAGFGCFVLIILFAAQGQCRAATKNIQDAVATVKQKVQQRLAANHLQSRPMPSATLKMTPDKPPIPLEDIQEDKPQQQEQEQEPKE
ncbi:MAG: hypothetical protein JEZ07_02105 [Phycisphaerae bacterium]|nr:hypothetical protein [Phycisphaerae bacterium]